MPRASKRTNSSQKRQSPRKLIKVYTERGRISTVSLPKHLYESVDRQVGVKARLAAARYAAKEFESAKTDKTRSGYVADFLRSTFNIERTQDEKAAAERERKPYPYVQLRVKDSAGKPTNVSLSPQFMAKVKKKLGDEKIQQIAEDAAARYDYSAPFSRSAFIQRELKVKLGERVPSEVALFMKKFKLKKHEVASILRVSEEDVQRWEDTGEIDSGPARLMLSSLWKGKMKLSDIFSKQRTFS